jgi:nitric oxide reductase subunit B
MYTMEQITGDKNIGLQKKSFAFYFLGLTNLMFNWGHHTYVVPANPVIRQVSYIISMTELILLANILITWSASFKKAPVAGYNLSYRFFRTADVWVLLNLVLAIVISVPYINQCTHGTQITVAHAMGATIGINTLLLMGCITFLFEKQMNNHAAKTVNIGLKVMHISLVCFWLSLIGAGVVRSMAQQQQIYFVQLSERVQPYLKFVSASGLFLVIGICMVSITYITILFRQGSKS